MPPEEEQKDFISPRETLEPRPGELTVPNLEPAAEESAKEPEKTAKETEQAPEPEKKPEDPPEKIEDEHIKEELDAEPPKEPKVKKIPIGGGPFHRFKHWYGSHKKFTIPLTLIILVAVVAGVPWSRYKAAAVIVKKDYKVQVFDSEIHTPVSGADVSVGQATAVTDGNGFATLRAVKAGTQTIKVTKKYYEDKNVNVTVPILDQKSTTQVQFTATGRQTKISVTDLISGDKLEGVSIQVAGTNAKTDKDGNATMVLPAGTQTQKATLTLDDYNKKQVDIQISDQSVKENNFSLTPAGQVYFLSKRSGNLDVMKVALDGTNPQVVIAGTGVEQDNNTLLSNSPDGKYAALIAKRSPGDPQPQMYVFASDNEKLLPIESGNSTYTIEGWSGSSLIYTITRPDLPDFQTGKAKLKAYNAATGKTLTLDQSEASDPNSGLSQTYSLVMISGNQIVLAKHWTSTIPASLDSKQDSVQVVGVNGSSPKNVASYPASGYLEFSQHSPVALYIWSTSNSDSAKNAFYDYTVGGQPKQVNINSDKFYQSQHTYYFSPAGQQTVWTEDRDGKSAFLVGDDTGANSKVVASLSDFSAIGWHTEKYIISSKKTNELYIMGVNGKNQVKLTDYQSTYNYYQ